MAEYQNRLKFSLNETVPFRGDKAVKEIKSASLEPNVTCQEHGQYIVLRGKLVFCGEYFPGECDVREDLFADQNVADVYPCHDDGCYTFNYAFPVDITVPTDRVLSIEELSIGVENFDCTIQENGCVNVCAELFVDGVYERQYLESMRNSGDASAPAEQVADEQAVYEEVRANEAELADGEQADWQKQNASYDDHITYRTTYEYNPWNQDFNSNQYHQTGYSRQPYEATYSGGDEGQYYHRDVNYGQDANKQHQQAEQHNYDPTQAADYIKFSPSNAPQFEAPHADAYGQNFYARDTQFQEKQGIYDIPVNAANPQVQHEYTNARDAQFQENQGIYDNPMSAANQQVQQEYANARDAQFQENQGIYVDPMSAANPQVQQEYTNARDAQFQENQGKNEDPMGATNQQIKYEYANNQAPFMVYQNAEIQQAAAHDENLEYEEAAIHDKRELDQVDAEFQAPAQIDDQHENQAEEEHHNEANENENDVHFEAAPQFYEKNRQVDQEAEALDLASDIISFDQDFLEEEKKEYKPRDVKKAQDYDKVVFPFADEENAFAKSDEYKFDAGFDGFKAQPEYKQENIKVNREMGNSRVVSDIFSARGKAEKNSCLKVYIVQRGDSLDILAEKYDTNPSKIAKYNRLQVDEKIQEGQILYIPD